MSTPQLPEKYWLHPGGLDDVVVIHVCDENRQVNRDFCCKRDILVRHMKYFENFLAENENGYDDIDISVHCDVEIFDWLMAYIHLPESHPPLDKAIVVSILISSEFLQMDVLVELCLEHIANNLNDIVKLPIDLSCISEKLINKLAFLTSPKTLAVTKDRKDKILNKLYKRRVELDFSRKNLPRGGSRSIAASLTCCQYCGSVYLDSCVSTLACKLSRPALDFRGKLVRRHHAISSWSLTAYLKALHAGGMPWEVIYWHVWGACEVFQVGDITISALDIDRYSVELDGLLINSKTKVEPSSDPAVASSGISLTASLDKSLGAISVFSLEVEDDRSAHIRTYKLPVTQPSVFDTLTGPDAHITPSLNPNRPPTVLTSEVHELVLLQLKLISGSTHRELIETTGMAQVTVAATEDHDVAPILTEFCDLLWPDEAGDSQAIAGDDVGEEERGRSLSPGRGAGKDGIGRRAAQSSRNLVRDADMNAPLLPPGATATALQERRSRSQGARSRTAYVTKGKSSRGKVSKSAVDASGGQTELDAAPAKLLDVFRSFPPELQRVIKSHKGPICGIWTVTHPLQLHPLAYHETLTTIQDSGLPELKRLEWELDVLRDYDIRRIDKFEDFLLSCRDNSTESKRKAGTNSDKLKTVSSKREEGGRPTRTAGDYYKDKGRQPHKP